MPLVNIEYTLKSTDRVDVRKEMLLVFSNEAPGIGTGDQSSKYNYCVETLSTNSKTYKILLKRPAALNKGLDFVVSIDGLFFKKNRRYSNPGHNDIIDAIKQVKDSCQNIQYKSVAEAINKLFNCEDIDIISLSNFYFSDHEGTKHPIAVILLAAKWLFIEQDMTYWNWSGRNMLMNHLSKAGLV